MLTKLNQLLTSGVRGREGVDLGCRRSLSLGWVDPWVGLWTLDTEDSSVRSRGRQISLMKKPMSCGTVSCSKISMASLMRLVCHELIGMMSWAACHSIWWSLMWDLTWCHRKLSLLIFLTMQSYKF